MAGPHCECAAHVSLPVGGTEAGLGRGMPGAAEKIGDGFSARKPTQFESEKSRLIEAPSEQASAMQGHRHDDVGVIKKFLADAMKPAGKHGHRIMAIPVFQRHDNPRALVAVAHDTTGAVIGWRYSKAMGTEDVGPCIIVKGQAAALAERFGDEGNPGPAIGA